MIKLAYDNTLQRADLVRSDGANLETDEGFETAVTTSLFSDARAQESDGLDPEADPRGWWAAKYLTPEGEYGSRLWLVTRNKMTQANLLLAKQYAREALQWMIDARVAADVTVTIERMTGRNDVGVMTVSIQRPERSAPRFERAWEVQFGV